MNQITQTEINKAAWSACDAFRGVVDPSIYKDYVLTMLFLKYVSDIWKDHKTRYEAEHLDSPELVDALMSQETFVLPDEASFDTLHQRRHEAGNGERIDKVLHAIEEANGSKLRNVFQDISFNSNKLGNEEQKNEILRHLIESYASPALDLRPSRIGKLDIIGGTYEYLISQFAASAGKKAGEFYTPAEVSELIARLVDPQPGDDICDPTCGSASLLMKCGRLIQNNEGNGYALFGQEAIGSTWALAKMNLFLHGEENHQIEWGDTIRNPKLRTSRNTLRHFDVVVANPPFSLKNWGVESAKIDNFSRFRRGIPPKSKGDFAFILHMIETLKPNTGRMAVVAPHGVLFRGGSEGKIRKQLIEENLLDAVIGLPGKMFFGTPITAAILTFKKRRADDSVLFIDASRDFTAGTKQNILTMEHIEKIMSTYEARRSIEKYAYRASREEIVRNEFNLNIPRYVDTFEEGMEIDLMAVRAERMQLKADMAVLESQMEAYLLELGYGL